MKPAIPFAMIFLAAGLRAQTGCLAIQFQEVAQQTTWDASSLTASGLLRQADGSFTEETYNINLNQPAKTGSVADFQQNFFNCVGLAARSWEKTLSAPAAPIRSRWIWRAPACLSWPASGKISRPTRWWWAISIPTFR
jgi:hypothetical protein